MTTTLTFERISAPVVRRSPGASMAHVLALAVHGLVLVIGAVAMVIMAIAVLLDGGSRALDRAAQR